MARRYRLALEAGARYLAVGEEGVSCATTPRGAPTVVTIETSRGTTPCPTNSIGAIGSVSTGAGA